MITLDACWKHGKAPVLHRLSRGEFPLDNHFTFYRLLSHDLHLGDEGSLGLGCRGFKP